MHRVAIAVHRVKSCVAVPRLVKVQTIDTGAEELFYTCHVVAKSVIRGVRDDRVLRRAIGNALGKRVIVDQLVDRYPSETFGGNRADDAVVIAHRHEVGRNRPRHRHRMLGGLVTIAIAQRDLVATDACHQDDAV